MGTARALAAQEPSCAKCDSFKGDGTRPLCTCGRSYDERKAEGFRDAVGLTSVLWLSKEEMLERYPSPDAEKAPPSPKEERR